MQCIKCQDTMQKTIYESILVDYCPSCKSFWLDGGEFDLIIKGKEWDVEKAFTEAEIEKTKESKDNQDFSLCPRCNKGVLRSLRRSGVRIDQCDKCDGLFFDEGELESLYRAEKMNAFQRIWEHVTSLL